VNVKAILELVEKVFHQNDILIKSTRVLGGGYLDHNGIMVEHYGVISKISKEGVSAISEQAKEKLETDYKESLAAGAKVLGGNQFLAQHPQFSAFSLLVLNDNIGTKRLAGGTYAMQVKVLGAPYILLNPFHAYQLVPYTTVGNAVIAFECFSEKPWEFLRQKVCGATDPKAAEEGSLRNLFLANKASLGLAEVDKGTNGIHMSAGALEGMVELARFFSDHDSGNRITYDQTAFGSLLLSKGLSLERVIALAKNPILSIESKAVSAFDATEEKDASNAASLLAAL